MINREETAAPDTNDSPPFPSSWTAAMNAQGRECLRKWADTSTEPHLSGNVPMSVSANVLKPAVSDSMRETLYKSFYPLLETGNKQIPSEAMSGLEESGTERLPKTYHLKGCSLDETDSEAYNRACNLGVLSLLNSEELLNVAEGVSNYTLEGPVGRELLCYEEGDYSGPHTDHHPNDPHRNSGYVDIHLTLCNEYVSQQLLVCSRNNHLSQQFDVGRNSAISLSRLPVWHYTTPLVAKSGHQEDARRWLLLATYQQTSD